MSCKIIDHYAQLAQANHKGNKQKKDLLNQEGNPSSLAFRNDIKIVANGIRCTVFLNLFYLPMYHTTVATCNLNGSEVIFSRAKGKGQDAKSAVKQDAF